MKNNIKAILKLNALVLLILCTMLSLSSCKKFLDEKPSKTTSLVVTTTQQLDALLNNYSTFYSESNLTAMLSTDDYGLSVDLYNGGPGIFPVPLAQYAFWNNDFIADDRYNGSFWSGEYKKIFTANMVLANLDRVTGPAEDKDKLRADAHFIRAYSYFELANTYCLPYTDANKDAPGLPIKKTVSFAEPVARAPLSAVYDLIEADLAEAMKTTVPLIQNGVAHNWRANIPAVNGFAARYYLSRNNYTEALKYANLALGAYSQLVDYNTEMHYGRPSTITIDGGTPQQKSVTLQFPYTHDNQTDMTDMIGWKEFLYFRMQNFGYWWYAPSQDLLSLYDTASDLRYKYHIVENYSYDRGMIKPSYSYPGYIFFFKDRVPSGPTTAEMYLIKAECLARTNDVGGAMTALNMLRVKRMKTGTPALSAASKDEAIKIILDERRREMPFSMRWYDLRRINNNDDPNDDIVLTKTFYPFTASSIQSDQAPITYTLDKQSKRYATPIPRTEIISSQGVIEQNNY